MNKYKFFEKFELGNKITVELSISECDCIRYTPHSLKSVQEGFYKKCNNMPREDSAVSSKDNILEIEFKRKHKSCIALYADVDRKNLVILGKNAFFGKHNLTSSTGKEMEQFENAHMESLMYKL